MRKFLSTVALMLSVMLVASTSHATETYTGTYTGALAGAGLWLNTQDEAPEVGGFGGYQFQGTEGEPLSLTIEDASGGIVAYTVAQDLNNNLQSGEAGEPSVSGCGKGGSLEGSLVPFQEGLPVTVFLYSAARGLVPPRPCQGVVTHGTLTLTTAGPAA